MPIASPPLRLDLPDDWQSARAVLSGKLMNYFDQLAKRGGLNVDPAEIAATGGVAWTPTLSFAVPGNLVVAYSFQSGMAFKLGSLVLLFFRLVTSSFTWTTASGVAQILGLPYVASNVDTNAIFTSSCLWSGITKAGYTQVNTEIFPNTNIGRLTASGSGVGAAGIQAADMPSGGAISLRGTFFYLI